MHLRSVLSILWGSDVVCRALSHSLDSPRMCRHLLGHEIRQSCILSTAVLHSSSSAGVDFHSTGCEM